MILAKSEKSETWKRKTREIKDRNRGQTLNFDKLIANVTYYSTARGSVADRQLRIEVMSPDSRYKTDIITGIDALEMIDR